MMGSAPTGGGSELSFTDVIGMLKDEPSYQTKLREINNRLNETKAAAQAIKDISDKTEATRKFTAEMAAKAEAQLLEAKQLKEAADKQAEKADLHERDLKVQYDNWQKEVAEQKEQATKQLQDAFVSRETQVAAQEKSLLAKMKEFKAQTSDFEAERSAYVKELAAKEVELGRRETALKDGNQELAAARAEVTALKAELKEKLNKIKAISVG